MAPYTSTCLLLLTTVVAATDVTSNYSVLNLIQDIHSVENFQHILVLQHPKDIISEDFGRNFVKDLSAAVHLPIITLSHASFFLSGTFSSDLLSVVSVAPETASATLQLLVQNLRQITVTRVVFLLNCDSKDEGTLRGLFLDCASEGVINAIAVFRDFPRTNTFYRFSHMPTFAIEGVQARQLPSEDTYFPDRLQNMMGHPIRIVYGGAEPKVIFSWKPNGELQVGGYVGHFLDCIGKRHNTTFVGENITRLIASQELVSMVRNKSAEISAGLTFSWPPREGFTYPYETISWCLMLPIEPSIPIYEVFMIVFRSDMLAITAASIVVLSALLEYSKRRCGRGTDLLSFVFNDDCLRGILGQSFIEIRQASRKVKFVYLHIFLLGIILTTSYSSYLQTYLTSPPSQGKIRTFEDLLASGLKVYSFKQEYQTLIENVPMFREYYQMFKIEEDFDEYVKFRDSFNTRYAYMVNNGKWVIIKEQQQIFTKPLFRQPEGMCFFELMQLCFPIAENSIYMDMINRMIVEVQDVGLLEFWQRHAFYELIAAKKLKLVDLTSKPKFEPMRVGDLLSIWIGLVCGLAFTALCFLLEVAVCARERRHRRLHSRPIII